jgi:cleavage and polyadenylation specificity factor subunit 1
VACSGYGKNGSISVLRRNVHTATNFSFKQEDCQALFAIKSRKEQYFEGLELEGNQVTRHSRAAVSDIQGGEQTTYDKFLVITKSKSTMVSYQCHLNRISHDS